MLKNNFNKKDLIKNLNNNIGFSLVFSKKIVDDLIKALIHHIKIGNLNLKNVGTFKIIKKKERIGRNPKTGEEVAITARQVVTFRSSNVLKSEVADLTENDNINIEENI